MESAEPPQPGIEPLADSDPRAAGPYRLLGRLGAGAMGRVYLGRKDGGPFVAVKVVRAELADQARYRRRFAREVESVRRVTGPRVAAVVDADLDAGLPWIATDYVPGSSLAAAIRDSGPWDSRRVRGLGAGMAEALLDIHAAGVVHRDLKPSNVLLSPDGPKVIDFGVARAADHAQVTSSGRISGTPAYMSPEQLAVESLASPSADVFAFGALLAFAATGRPAFGGGRPLAILDRVVNSAPDLAGAADDDPELRALIEACLDKDPAKRPDVTRILAVCRRTDALPVSSALSADIAADDPALAADPVPVFDIVPKPLITARGTRIRRRPSRRLIGVLASAALASMTTVTVVVAVSGRSGPSITAIGGQDNALRPFANPDGATVPTQSAAAASPSASASIPPAPSQSVALTPTTSPTTRPGQVPTGPLSTRPSTSAVPASQPGPSTAAQLNATRPGNLGPATAQATPTLLGAPDFNAYCRSAGWSGAYLNSKHGDVYGWRCVGDGSAIDPNDVCLEQFAASPPVVARFTDFNDPNSWQCWD